MYPGIDLLEEYRAAGFRVLHFPIEDFSVPSSMEDFHRFIEQLDAALRETAVYLHCSAGIGRTGLAAAGLLVFLKQEPSEAIQEIREVRPGAVETRGQKEFLSRYREFLRGR